MVLFLEDLEKSLEALYDMVPKQMNQWVIADDTWIQTNELLQESLFGFVDSSEPQARSF